MLRRIESACQVAKDKGRKVRCIYLGAGGFKLVADHVGRDGMAPVFVETPLGRLEVRRALGQSDGTVRLAA